MMLIELRARLGHTAAAAESIRKKRPWLALAGTVRAVLLPAVAALSMLACIPLPLLAPHGEIRGTAGVAFGRTRANTGNAARLTGNLDLVWLPTVMLGCDRDFDIGAGARFHFVEAETPGAHIARVGGVVSGTWLHHLGPNLRTELRLDVGVLELDRRALSNASVSVGIEVIGFAEGHGVGGSWDAVYAGAWSGEAAMRIEAVLGYYEDFGNVRYGTATLGLSIRWPAGAGIALINPISLLLLAAEINGPSSTGGTTSPPPSQTVSRPANEYSSGDSATRGCPEPPQDPRPRGTVPSAYDGYLCRAASDTSDDEVQARSHEHAMAACHEMTGEACTCRRSDDAPTSPP